MNAETKHTPGPWRFDPNNHGNGGPGYGLLNDSGSIGVTVETATSWHKPYPAAEANARLIAAAPELLEACERIAKTSPVVRQEDFDFLCAALVKAGRDPLAAFKKAGA